MTSSRFHETLRNCVSPLAQRYGVSCAINSAQVDLRSCVKFREIGCWNLHVGESFLKAKNTKNMDINMCNRSSEVEMNRESLRKHT